MSLKSFFKNHLINIPGWRTNKKIVVIESDDWGSIRMPNKEVYLKSLKIGLEPDKNPYTRFDTLANSKDLCYLFDILTSFKDFQGNHPIITINVVSGNPDFEKIKQSQFGEYFLETFRDTLNKYYPNENVWKLWTQGIDEKLFSPQFHGREHVNIYHWLKAIREKNKFLTHAFELGYWGIPDYLYKNDTKLNIQATYDALHSSEISEHIVSLVQGLKMFEQSFGFKSKTFIPNNFIFENKLMDQVLKTAGIEGLQGMKYHKQPSYGKKREMKRRFFGYERNMVNLIRNVTFEPSQEKSKRNVVNQAVKQIESAFFWGKPAIINSHRLNYIGVINEENRNENLLLLKELLGKIMLKWPDVEFIDSAELVGLIKNTNQL